MKQISSFNNVEIIDNSLLIINIDNTIFKNKISVEESWWTSKYEKYYNISHDHELAYSFVYQDWINLLKKNPPELIDGTNLFAVLDQARKKNCKIYLLTSENKTPRYVTEYYLTYFGITNFITSIHFVTNKSHDTIKIMEENNLNKDIIIIDESYKNILNIINAFKVASFSVNMHCYLIENDDCEL